MRILEGMRTKILVIIIVVFILKFFLIQYDIIYKVHWNHSLSIRSHFKHHHHHRHHQYKFTSNNLLNITNFTFIYTSSKMSQICKNHLTSDMDNKLLVVIIPSARENFKDRRLIRKTWGSINKYKNWSITKVFLLGDRTINKNSTAVKVQEQIANESHKYSDIIMGNFIDSYKNMSYKHLMGYKWIIDHCENADYVLKADDDVFVNIFQVINFIEQISDDSNSYYCYVNNDMAPFRTNNSKWMVTREEWPFDYYPIYCGFAAYLTQVQTVAKIYNASLKSDVKYFWIDDIFVTGLLREKVNKHEKESNPINLKDIEGHDVYSWSWEFAPKLKDYNCTGTNWDKKLFVVTEHDPLDPISVFWNCIFNGATQATTNN